MLPGHHQSPKPVDVGGVGCAVTWYDLQFLIGSPGTLKKPCQFDRRLMTKEERKERWR